MLQRRCPDRHQTGRRPSGHPRTTVPVVRSRFAQRVHSHARRHGPDVTARARIHQADHGLVACVGSCRCGGGEAHGGRSRSSPALARRRFGGEMNCRTREIGDHERRAGLLGMLSLGGFPKPTVAFLGCDGLSGTSRWGGPGPKAMKQRGFLA
jgi:hypothetical protein